MVTWDLHSLHDFRSRSLLLTCSRHSFVIVLTSLILVEFMNTCPKGNSSEVSGESLEKCSDLCVCVCVSGFDTAQNAVHWCERCYCPLGVRLGNIGCWSGRLRLQLQHETLVLKQKKEAFSRGSIIAVLIRCTIKIFFLFFFKRASETNCSVQVLL